MVFRSSSSAIWWNFAGQRVSRSSMNLEVSGDSSEAWTHLIQMVRRRRRQRLWKEAAHSRKNSSLMHKIVNGYRLFWKGIRFVPLRRFKMQNRFDHKPFFQRLRKQQGRKSFKNWHFFIFNTFELPIQNTKIWIILLFRVGNTPQAADFGLWKFRLPLLHDSVLKHCIDTSVHLRLLPQLALNFLTSTSIF